MPLLEEEGLGCLQLRLEVIAITKNKENKPHHMPFIVYILITFL